MKLDPKNIRHLSPTDWRVLTVIESCSRTQNHVPLPQLLASTRLPAPVLNPILSTLLSHKLISLPPSTRGSRPAHPSYRLTYGGADHLLLHGLARSGAVTQVASARFAVGKESDVFLVGDAAGGVAVLKLHRLGRVSFRRVREKRDYVAPAQRGRRSARGEAWSWMRLARQAAEREWRFLGVLFEAGFPVPEPRRWERHGVVMALVDGTVLEKVREIAGGEGAVGGLYAECLGLVVRLAGCGLVHGDLNEFNILLVEEKIPAAGGGEVVAVRPVMIDFPQMCSIQHHNAKSIFDRDVQGIKRFFARRFKFSSDEKGPQFEEAIRNVGKGEARKRLDIEAEATGFRKGEAAKEFDRYLESVRDELDGERDECDLSAGSGFEDEDEVDYGDHLEDEDADEKAGPETVSSSSETFDVATRDMIALSISSDFANASETGPLITGTNNDRSTNTSKELKASRGWAL